MASTSDFQAQRQQQQHCSPAPSWLRQGESTPPCFGVALQHAAPVLPQRLEHGACVMCASTQKLIACYKLYVSPMLASHQIRLVQQCYHAGADHGARRDRLHAGHAAGGVGGDAQVRSEPCSCFVWRSAVTINNCPGSPRALLHLHAFCLTSLPACAIPVVAMPAAPSPSSRAARSTASMTLATLTGRLACGPILTPSGRGKDAILSSIRRATSAR